MSRYKPINLDRIKTIPIRKRPSKTAVKAFGGLPKTTGARGFFDALPDFLKAAEFKAFIGAIVAARNRNRPFHLMMGAHVIKVGLAPVIIDMMKQKMITGISMNSAGLIHDLEIAFAGKTSEEVEAGLEDGSFGMAAETGAMFAGAVTLAKAKQIGLGEAAGIFIRSKRAKFASYSLFAAAHKYDLPATVHLMIGTDIVQQQPSFEAGPAAEASYLDFKILAEILKSADAGGVVANIGSSVVLPEVFLKALTVARNIKKQKSRLITANFDMISHYRPVQNVVKRPTRSGGRGFNFIGHHEIMIPLLYWGLKAYFKKTKK